MTQITVSQEGQISSPPHISKGTGYKLVPGDWVEVKTPGGGGWGDPHRRDPARVALDVDRGYLPPDVARETYAYHAPGTPVTDTAGPHSNLSPRALAKIPTRAHVVHLDLEKP
jgi:N-methylhydantoinase B/oxoprolinase/acetone carboxylase alpha subunit